MEKILIADDEQLMRQLVIDFLKPEGYEILEASDGKEALEIYDKEHPDLILLDVMMPGYDGWTGLPRNPPRIDGPHHDADGERGRNRPALRL